MLLSRGFIYPFSPLFSPERTLFARGDRFSFLFFLLSLRPDRGQRGLLSFAACLLISRCVSRGQWVLKGLVNNWKAFKEARKSYQCDPSKFTGRPLLPKYKHKTDGRNLLVYSIQALSKHGLKRGLIQPSMLPIEVKTQQQNIDQVRIIPRKGFYVV